VTTVDRPASPTPIGASAMPPRRGLLVWCLASLCVLAVWLLFYGLVLSSLQESRAQTVSYSQLREQLALQTAPLGGSLKPGQPVALLSAPALGLNDLVVSEGTASADLFSGPGHRRDTVLPGQTGVSVIYGRARFFGGPFGQISSAKVGDKIVATTGQGVFDFSIISVRRPGDPLPAALAGGASRLTLVTADGGVAPAGPVFVDAALLGEAQPSPGLSIRVPPQAERAMQGDPSSLQALALYLPLLGIALVVVLWMWFGWGKWQAWIVGISLGLALMWLVSGPIFALLPNLL